MSCYSLLVGSNVLEVADQTRCLTSNRHPFREGPRRHTIDNYGITASTSYLAARVANRPCAHILLCNKRKPKGLHYSRGRYWSGISGRGSGLSDNVGDWSPTVNENTHWLVGIADPQRTKSDGALRLHLHLHPTSPRIQVRPYLNNQGGIVMGRLVGSGC